MTWPFWLFSSCRNEYIFWLESLDGDLADASSTSSRIGSLFLSVYCKETKFSGFLILWFIVAVISTAIEYVVRKPNLLFWKYPILLKLSYVKLYNLNDKLKKKFLIKTLPDNYFEFFNKIYNEQQTPENWSKILTTMIYKNRDAKCALNYRPIAIVNCLGNIFTSILKRRLEKWLSIIGTNRIQKRKRLPWQHLYNGFPNKGEAQDGRK